MAKEKKSFILYVDYRQHLEILSDQERGQLLMALFDYADGIEPDGLAGATRMAFSFIRAQIDRDTEKWEATRQAKVEAGKLGGLKSGEARRNKAELSTGKQDEANEAGASCASEIEANEAVTVTVTANVNDNVTANVIKPPPTPSRGETPTVQEQRFTKFWQTYPKKVGKKAAQGSWKRLKPDAVLFDKIIQAVEAAKNSTQWERENGRYIPNPSTYLNQGRWDDELDEISACINREPPKLSGFHMAGNEPATSNGNGSSRPATTPEAFSLSGFKTTEGE